MRLFKFNIILIFYVHNFLLFGVISVMAAVSEKMGLVPKRALLVDDHALVRASLRFTLQKIESIQVVGEAETGWLGVKLARELKPDLVILDFKLPDISGLEVTQRLLKIDPRLKILILTAETHELAPSWVFSAGAHGFLAKTATPVELQQTLATIFNSSSLGEINEAPPATKTSIFQNLTTREVEIMRMLVRGDSTSTIAQQLRLEIQTIYTYRSNIFKKLNVKNRVALTLLALRHRMTLD
jgi:two-component system, NarL family, invasion response regulator UvrY